MSTINDKTANYCYLEIYSLICDIHLGAGWRQCARTSHPYRGQDRVTDCDATRRRRRLTTRRRQQHQQWHWRRYSVAIIGDFEYRRHRHYYWNGYWRGVWVSAFIRWEQKEEHKKRKKETKNIKKKQLVISWEIQVVMVAAARAHHHMFIIRDIFRRVEREVGRQRCRGQPLISC